MASTAEQTFFAAIARAESTRQQTKAAAALTFAFVAANYAAYVAALAAADLAYQTAVAAAATTLGATAGIMGVSGPWASTWAPIGEGL